MKILYITTKLKEFVNPICERCKTEQCEKCKLHKTIINVLDRLLDGEPIERENNHGNDNGK